MGQRRATSKAEEIATRRRLIERLQPELNLFTTEQRPPPATETLKRAGDADTMAEVLASAACLAGGATVARAFAMLAGPEAIADVAYGLGIAGAAFIALGLWLPERTDADAPGPMAFNIVLLQIGKTEAAASLTLWLVGDPGTPTGLTGLAGALTLMAIRHARRRRLKT